MDIIRHQEIQIDCIVMFLCVHERHNNLTEFNKTLPEHHTIGYNRTLNFNYLPLIPI